MMNWYYKLSIWTAAFWSVTALGLGCCRYSMNAIEDAEEAVDWATLAEIGVHDFDDDVALQARRDIGGMLLRREGPVGVEPLGPPIRLALSSDDSDRQKAGLDLLRRISLEYAIRKWGGHPKAGPVTEQPFWKELVPLAARVTILLGPELEELSLWYLHCFCSVLRSEEVFVMVEATLKELAEDNVGFIRRDANFILGQVRVMRDEYRLNSTTDDASR